MTSVLVVGMVVIDFVFEVDAMPTTADKYVASGASVVGGGGAANAAVAIAKLGGRALLSGRIGNDMIGDLIVNDLRGFDVDCSLLQRSSGATSSYSSVLIDRAGERLIINYRGKNLSDDVGPMIQFGSQTDRHPGAILADTRWSKGVVAAMKLARQIGVPGILDAEDPLDTEVLHLASHIAFSRQGLESLTGDDNLERGLLKAAETYQNWLCVTDGGNGVYYLHNGIVHHVPAPEVNVVDTLGAGDVWHGAFALAMADKSILKAAEADPSAENSELEAIRFANAVASLTCSRTGGGRVSPTLVEVNSFLSQQLNKAKQQ